MGKSIEQEEQVIEEQSPRANAWAVDMLSRRFGVAHTDVEDIFLGENFAEAHSLCKWVAEETDAKSPKDRGVVLTGTARKRGLGKYKDRSYYGPSRGRTKTPKKKERAPKRTKEEIERALSGMGA